MNNELVPIESIENKQNLVIYKSKKRRFLFFKLIFIAIFVGMALIIYFNFDKIFSFFEKSADVPFENDSSFESNTISSNTQASNTPSKEIPSNAYEIIENSFVFSTITNESEFELDVLEYNPKKTNEIYKKYGNEAPVVLIIHSACLEAYSNGSFYTTNDEFYSTKNNVRNVGKIIASTLTDLGVNAVHIENIFANGGIYSSKEEYESVLKDALRKYPSIEYVIDISRDIIISDDMTMIKPVCSKNGVKMAQMKLWVGSSTKNELWKSNLSLATMLASQNPDITSEVILSSFSFSSDICPQFLKIDVGAYSNTYEEACLLAYEIAYRFASLIS